MKYKTSTNAAELITAVEESSKTKYPVHPRAIVSMREAGSIIGKGGHSIQAISAKHNVKISLSHEKVGRRRLAHVVGSHNSCADAWTHMLHRIVEIEAHDEHYECHEDYGIDFVLPDALITCLVEENVLATISKESHTKLCVKPDYLPRSTERIVRISIRNKENIQHFSRAVNLLCEQLSKNARLALSFPGNMFYAYSSEDDVDLCTICNTSNEDEIIYNHCI
ncbi:MAG: hypothetical protein EXX96DRAFT_368430 [Benjaminiella poitrasii]|nr:MAG: hypothetical protein EXX96DRAFT_368430 [Benjaminiella poitrasii]